MFKCIYCAPDDIDFLDQATALLKCGNCKVKRWCVYIEENGG